MVPGQASRAASHARKTMVASLDELDEMFADLELLQQIYRVDENIDKAFVKLLADTLFAAENGIGLFLEGTGTPAA